VGFLVYGKLATKALMKLEFVFLRCNVKYFAKFHRKNPCHCGDYEMTGVCVGLSDLIRTRFSLFGLILYVKYHFHTVHCEFSNLIQLKYLGTA